MLIDLLIAFAIGGLICTIGQFVFDFFKLTPGHVTAYLVVLGAFLDIFGLYDKLIDFAGAGAMVPITSFGHSLMHGAMEEASNSGFLGISSGMFSLTASGITAAIVFSFVMALIFKPKG